MSSTQREATYVTNMLPRLIISIPPPLLNEVNGQYKVYLPFRWVLSAMWLCKLR
jgi:hypothetical protein